MTTDIPPRVITSDGTLFLTVKTDAVRTLAASTRSGPVEFFDLTGLVPGDSYDLLVKAKPSLILGPAGQALAGIKPAGGTQVLLTAPDVAVADNLAGQTRTITPGTIDLGYLTNGKDGASPDPERSRTLLSRISSGLTSLRPLPSPPVILCGPGARPVLRQLLEGVLPNLVVLSYTEIPSTVRVRAVGSVN